MEFKKISLEVIRKVNQKMIDKGIVDKYYENIEENKINNQGNECVTTNMKYILSLDRYSEVYERGTGILQNEDGEYIKLEDVLNLFSANNEK